VSVNGRVVTELGTRADPLSDHIKVRGKLLPRPREHVYFAYHKPAGFVTTMSDPEGRPCVGDVVRAIGQAVVPVGRLDFHSSGLLLLTNDGALCERLTHPRYHVEKAYRVKVRGTPDGHALQRLRAGLWLDDGKTAPASVRVEHGRDEKTWLELRLHEGRNRQVRRMLEAVGLRVEKLRRTVIGPLRLGSLGTGEIRPLTAKEVTSLRRAVDL
jgi:pseudouridine synthase